MRASENPARSRATSPATVVPPGEHTESTRSAGLRPDPVEARRSASAWTMRAVPRTAWVTISTAWALGIPSRSPPRASASMRVSTNAGEELARDTKAGRSLSSRTTVRPTRSVRARTCSTSRALARLPAVRAVMDWPTAAAILGMARTTRVPVGSRASRRAVDSPAARETTSGWWEATASCTCAATTGTTCGLTARTTTALVDTSSGPLAARRTPTSWASVAAEERALVTARSQGGMPAATAPRTIAPAMLPAPMNP